MVHKPDSAQIADQHKFFTASEVAKVLLVLNKAALEMFLAPLEILPFDTKALSGFMAMYAPIWSAKVSLLVS